MRDWAVCTHLARSFANRIGKSFEWLVGGKHVVVSSDNRDVRAAAAAQRCLVRCAAGGKRVGEIPAGQMAPVRPRSARGGNACEIRFALVATTFDDAAGDVGDDRIEPH